MAMIAMTTNNSMSVNARNIRVDRERFTFMAGPSSYKIHTHPSIIDDISGTPPVIPAY
jgi:hypothetical protein